jgi:hypothetical protein
MVWCNAIFDSLLVQVPTVLTERKRQDDINICPSDPLKVIRIVREVIQCLVQLKGHKPTDYVDNTLQKETIQLKH